MPAPRKPLMRMRGVWLNVVVASGDAQFVQHESHADDKQDGDQSESQYRGVSKDIPVKEENAEIVDRPDPEKGELPGEAQGRERVDDKGVRRTAEAQ